MSSSGTARRAFALHRSFGGKEIDSRSDASAMIRQMCQGTLLQRGSCEQRESEKEELEPVESLDSIQVFSFFFLLVLWGIYLTQVAPRCSMRCDGGLSAELG